MKVLLQLSIPVLAFAVCLAAAVPEEQPKTVFGPTNPDLFDGAHALNAGDVHEGIRLTRAGLAVASSDRERVVGFANLCAGYALLEEYATALEYCNRALEINDRHWRSYSNRALVYIKQQRFEEAARDLDKGQAISPGSEKLKTVRALLLDEIDPVRPSIVIDDRRQAVDDDGDD